MIILYKSEMNKGLHLYYKDAGPFAASVLSRLRDPGDAYINFRDFVPGGIICYAGLGQVKNALKDADCIGGPGAINTVCGYGGNGGVVPGDAVQLGLELTHLVAGGTYT